MTHQCDGAGPECTRQQRRPPMMKRTTLLGLLIPLLCPLGALAAEAPETGGRTLDLELLQQDIPSGARKSALSPPEDRLPSFGTRQILENAHEGMSPKGGFRSDLPYGVGYEARQGRGAGSGLGQSGRGMGGGRGR